MRLPPIPRTLTAGSSLPGETRAQAGLRVWNSMLKVLGRTDMDGVSLLDIGCGDRLTQAIVEFDLAIGSYLGSDIRKPVIEWLVAHNPDPRCSYAHFDAYNIRYWPTGAPLNKRMDLPGGQFDVLFAQSVFSHLYPYETDIMLTLARRRVREDGVFLLTGFLSDQVVLFEDRHADNPTARIYYHPDFMSALLRKSGWEIVKMVAAGEPGFGQGTQNALLVRPIAPQPLPPGFG